MIPCHRTKMISEVQYSNPHVKAVTSVQISSLGNILATSSADKKSCILSPQTLDVLQTLQEHNAGINCSVWMPHSDRFLVTGSDDKSIKVWDIEACKSIITLNVHKSFVYSLAVNPINDLIISGDKDGIIKIFDMRIQHQILSYEAHSKAITSIACNPNGRDFLTTSFDGYTRLWDFLPSTNLTSCPCIASIYDQKFTPISSACYSSNGQYAAISSFTSKINLFAIQSHAIQYIPTFGACLRVFSGHINEHYSIQTLLVKHHVTNKNYVLSASEDNAVYLWDINDVENTHSPTKIIEHTDIVLSTTYHEETSTIVSGCKDGSIGIVSLDKYHDIKNTQNSTTNTSSNNNDMTE